MPPACILCLPSRAYACHRRLQPLCLRTTCGVCRLENCGCAADALRSAANGFLSSLLEDNMTVGVRGWIPCYWWAGTACRCVWQAMVTGAFFWLVRTQSFSWTSHSGEETEGAGSKSGYACWAFCMPACKH